MPQHNYRSLEHLASDIEALDDVLAKHKEPLEASALTRLSSAVLFLAAELSQLKSQLQSGRRRSASLGTEDLNRHTER